MAILRCLRRRALGHPPPVYVVGGPVRDTLMGMPTRDLDFVVEGDGFEVARWLGAELGGEVRTHPRFGTATVIKGPSRVDVVTARRETYPRPAALPEVSSGAISDDLARRDFSINALAVPLGELNPQVMDPHGGLQDIRDGLVRVLHPASFVDDPTRLLRVVRYEQRLGFEIETGTAGLLNDAIGQGSLDALSADRLRHELEKFLEEERPELPLKRSVALGIMGEIHPAWGGGEALARLDAIGSCSPGWGDATRPGAGPLMLIAGLSYSLSSAEAEAAVHRLNLTKDWAQVVRDTALLGSREEELGVVTLPDSQTARMVRNLHTEAVTAVSRLTDSPLVARRLKRYLTKSRFLTPALDGGDLLAMGVSPGPAVGRLLSQLRDAKLDGNAATEADERRLVRDLLDEREKPTDHG